MQTISRRSPSRFRPAERHRRVSGKGRPSSSAGLPQANLTPNPKAPISTARQAERFLFSERTPNELVDRVVVKLSSEGLLAIVDLLFLDPVTPSNETKVLVGRGRLAASPLPPAREMLRGAGSGRRSAWGRGIIKTGPNFEFE